MPTTDQDIEEKPVTADDVLRELLRVKEIARRIAQLRIDGMHAMIPAWEKRLANKGGLLWTKWRKWKGLDPEPPDEDESEGTEGTPCA